jgi:hypothetical protein
MTTRRRKPAKAVPKRRKPVSFGPTKTRAAYPNIDFRRRSRRRPVRPAPVLDTLAERPLRRYRSKVSIRKTNKQKSKDHRERLDRQEIRPCVPVGPRVIELLIRMTIKYGGLTPAVAEAKSRDRSWVVAELVRLHEKLADDWGIER